MVKSQTIKDHLRIKMIKKLLHFARNDGVLLFVYYPVLSLKSQVSCLKSPYSNISSICCISFLME